MFVKKHVNFTQMILGRKDLNFTEIDKKEKRKLNSANDHRKKSGQRKKKVLCEIVMEKKSEFDIRVLGKCMNFR